MIDVNVYLLVRISTKVSVEGRFGNFERLCVLLPEEAAS
jgi:hypothetical protein